MKRVERIRLYPTASQAARLGFMLHATRHLYNALLQERRDAYRYRGIALTAQVQYAELTALRHEDPGFASVYRECQDAVLRRLDLAFTAFFRRVKCGETPGYPRFKAASRWEQLSFPHGDRALKLDAGQRRLRVPGVGPVALRKGRTVPAFGRDGWFVAMAGGMGALSASVRCGRYRVTPSSSVSTAACT
jgi:putative transposase